MTRLVRGADGRMWTVRSQIEWRNPSTDADFEHDVSGGHGAGRADALPGDRMAVCGGAGRRRRSSCRRG